MKFKIFGIEFEFWKKTIPPSTIDVYEVFDSLLEHCGFDNEKAIILIQKTIAAKNGGCDMIISPREVHQNAVDHGWWPDDKTTRNVAEQIALMHSELSEALEGYRNHVKQGEKGYIGEELADTIIRIFDFCEGMGIDIVGEVIKKHHYNKTRPYRHGGKAC